MPAGGKGHTDGKRIAPHRRFLKGKEKLNEERNEELTRGTLLTNYLKKRTTTVSSNRGTPVGCSLGTTRDNFP